MLDIDPKSTNNQGEKDHAWSLLEEILRSQKPEVPWVDMWVSTAPEITESLPKKKIEPISWDLFLRLIGALLSVVIVFFGSFLAYIVFNPDQATFFINIFGINPNDIANLLKKLINGSFWITLFVISILWMISLFRAIWTPKALKRKKLLSGLTAWLLGIILFSILSLWAYLFTIINATDYTNPEGSILIYNNELYIDKDVRDYAQITNGSNLIWPITLLFDIRSNAALITKRNWVRIKDFSIDSDGGICNDGGPTVNGTDAIGEKSIICTFDLIKSYKVTGSYTVITRTGEEQKIPMNITPIEIRGLVNITRSKNIQGKNIITLNAESLKKIGNPRWVYLQSNNKVVSTASITETLEIIPKYVCLRLLSDGCDHIYILEDREKTDITGTINSVQDPVDPLMFHFSLSGSSIDSRQVTEIEWIMYNDRWSQTVICSNSGDQCEYRFWAYGTENIRAVIMTANNKRYTIETVISIREPLKISKNMKVMDSNGVIINTPSTYKTDLRAYVIENTLTPPITLTLDARDITSSKDGYNLESVVWKISDGKTTEEKRWDRISVTLTEPLRYTIEWSYTFKRERTAEIEKARDVVIIDIERKSLMPKLDISVDSDYVPSIVTVDASQSQSENGEIKKFIFNFWENKDPAEWDAIQTYEYISAWQKKISVTLVSESGERATVERIIVLKDAAKTIDFAPSFSPGIVNSTIDFQTVDTNGQIQEYIWNFGDNTPTVRGESSSHIFRKPGIYLISLTIVYTDGTRKTETKKFEVTASAWG